MPTTVPLTEKYNAYNLGDLRHLIESLAHLPDNTPLEIIGDECADAELQIQLHERSWGPKEQGRMVTYNENWEPIPVKLPVLIFSEAESFSPSDLMRDP